ncbi:flippase [Methanobrevibacter filiformis]|uniref:Polysaccharide biosynthesis protein n=1 Tax=Methanobrevibacter filiformis TaxID=55758 RepID=A0A166A572_9EURY|nr:flippase [Methanobrevibacter filiformis]KZX11584.1 polysaccharide biosynthesis protein [Methanobrevibacter filiformis]
MSEYKSFVQRIGLVGISNLLISLSALIFIPIITKNFSIGDYGIWAQVNTTIALIPNIANLGLPYTMVRFLSAENDKTKIKESFYSMLAIVFASSLLISIILIIFQNPIANALFDGNIQVLYIVSIISFFACMNLMIISFFRTFQQIKRYSLFLILQSYVGLMLSAYLVLTGYNIETVVLGLLTGYLVVFIVMVLLIGNYLGFDIPKFKNLKEELNFAIPTIPSNISSWIVDSSDKYVIGIFLGSAAVGYYAPSYAIGSILLMFLSPFAVMLPAVLPKYFEKGDLNKVNEFLKYSMKYFLLITIPGGFGLSILSKPILMIISTNEIAMNGYLITPFVCLGAIFMGIYGIINNILILEKKTKILGKLWIFVAILNVILNIFAVPYIGIIGAAIATLISYIFAFIITTVHSKRYLKLPFEYKSILKIIIASVIMGIFLLYMKPVGIIAILIVILIAVVIYFGVLFILQGINKEEFNFLKKMIG